MIIITPAIILSGNELLNKTFPKNVADAPKIIKTNENPRVNKIIGVRFIFLFLTNSSKVEPDIYDI